MTGPRAAAFFRVEGVLVRRTALHAAGWMAARQRHVWGRIARLGAVALSSSLSVDSPLQDRGAATRLAWRALQGCSEDRLMVLGEDWFTDEIRPNLHAAGLKKLDQCRAMGLRPILVSDQPHVAIGALAGHLGVDTLLCNRLELENGRVTGKLLPPIVTGRIDGATAARLAAEHHLDLSSCLAYGATATDATLLASVGRPCTVTPDRALRRMAHELDWPVVDA